MQVAPFPELSAALFLPEKQQDDDLILAAAARREELELRLSELNKRKESRVQASKVLQTMDHSSSKKHRPQPGLVQPGQAVSAEALPSLSPHTSGVAKKLDGTPAHVAYSSKAMLLQGDSKHVSAESLSAPATIAVSAAAGPLQGQQQQPLKEVDVEPKTRGRRQLSTSDAATKLPPGATDEDWLSKLIEHLWPKIRKTVEDISWETVPPILHESKPSWVHGLNLKKFTMGAKEPDLRDVRCFVDEEDVMDDVFVEMDLEWVSKVDVEIELQVLGKDVSSFVPNFVEEQLAKLFTMVVGVEDVMVKGTVQIAMRPLLYRIPIVQAIQIGFTQMPEFEFTPTVEGGPMGSALNTLLPSVKSWLKSTVNEAIWMPYVLPEHFLLPLEEGAPDLQRPLGVLHCRIVEAENIPRMDMFGHADTLVEAYVRHTQRNTTKVVSGKDPKWENEVFTMPVHSVQHQKLKFALWDYDALSPNDEIGRCEIAIKEIPEGQAQDLWLDVTNESEEEQHAAKNGERGIQYSRGERALRALAKPVAGHTTKKTKLHVRVHWRTWNDEETKFIAHATKHGVRKTVLSQHGPGLDSAFKEMLLGGAVHVTVQQCKGLDVHGWLQRPSVKMVVRVDKLKPQHTPAFKVSRKGNADLSTGIIQVTVPGNVAGRDDVMVRIDIQEVGLLSGNDIVGSIVVPLKELMEEGCICGVRQLRQLNDAQSDDGRYGDQYSGRSGDMDEAKGGSRAKVDIRWVGTFT